ncbi:MAG: MopE-related protein [Deltaproteobacteria bacterium]|jgi:hypothetical protein
MHARSADLTRRLSSLVVLGLANVSLLEGCNTPTAMQPSRRPDAGRETDVIDAHTPLSPEAGFWIDAHTVLSPEDALLLEGDAATRDTLDAGSCPGVVGDDGTGLFPSSCTCVPDTSRACSLGPLPVVDTGACRRGVQRCIGTGEFGRWGESCEGAVGPSAERCENGIDDDCDGATDEDCGCVVGSTMDCYSGPSGTNSFGVCRSGTRTCIPGTPATYGACEGEVIPRAELCGNGLDDDCNGRVDEMCDDCTPVSSSEFVCDGADDDCNGRVDEGCVPCPWLIGVGGRCAVNVGGGTEAECTMILRRYADECRSAGMTWSGDTSCRLGGSPSNPTVYGGTGSCR